MEPDRPETPSPTRCAETTGRVSFEDEPERDVPQSKDLLPELLRHRAALRRYIDWWLTEDDRFLQNLLANGGNSAGPKASHGRVAAQPTRSQPPPQPVSLPRAESQDSFRPKRASNASQDSQETRATSISHSLPHANSDEFADSMFPSSHRPVGAYTTAMKTYARASGIVGVNMGDAGLDALPSHTGVESSSIYDRISDRENRRNSCSGRRSSSQMGSQRNSASYMSNRKKTARNVLGMDQELSRQNSTSWEARLEILDSYLEDAARVAWPLAKIERAVAHVCFEMVSMLVILANAIVLGVVTEVYARGAPRQPALEDLEMVFSVFYTAELILRMMAQRLEFFRGPDKEWNMLDLIIVITVFPEILDIGQASITENQSGFRITRIMRIFKAVRILKLLRLAKYMRASREVRVILDCLMGSMKATLSVAGLVFLLMYMFSVCFVQALTNNGLIFDDPQAMRYWGGLLIGMDSLLQATTGGEDWFYMASYLRLSGDHYYGLFLVYIVFFMIVVLNTITTLFLDALAQRQKVNEDHTMREQMKHKYEYMTKLKDLHRRMDKDDSGAITLDEFYNHLGDPDMVAFAATLEIDVTDLEIVFDILSEYGQHPIDLETFVVGSIKLRGPAKSVDMVDLLLRQKRNSKEVRYIHNMCKKHFEDLNTKLTHVYGAIHYTESMSIASMSDGNGSFTHSPRASKPPYASKLGTHLQKSPSSLPAISDLDGALDDEGPPVIGLGSDGASTL